MKTLLTALLPAAMTLTGCLCGGFEGQDDQVLRTANGDALQLCSNGGYSAMLANGTILEGHINNEGTLIAGSAGETGARAFTMTTEADGSRTSTDLGAGWTTVVLDQVELDHAHVQCADLETRAWWPMSAASLPVDTGFTRTTGKVTEQILLCADGTARVPSVTGQIETAQYIAQAGKISVHGSVEIEARYNMAGTLSTKIAGQDHSVWTRVAGARCQ